MSSRGTLERIRNLSRPGVRIINCPPRHKEMQVTQSQGLMQGINLWIVMLVKNQSSTVARRNKPG